LLIHILQKPAATNQIAEMLQANRFYIKTVIDIRQQILAGGGEMHSDCEIVLLDNGSKQQDIWGASWNPISQEIFYESMVNLRPRQNRLPPVGYANDGNFGFDDSRTGKTSHSQVVRRSMNNWTVEETAFRCQRLSVRLEQLTQNFLRMGSLSLEGKDAETVLEILRECKVFLELTALA
jgi:Protein of unknown function (DUF5674)